ncbi:uncharacterized protein HKW66_Vig0089980 [Vigna angularis]|uniref:Uncharacterized protein n=1 Tax=Phaseolus angularis TaxID=3914 RepID=A0A8T0KGB4_PHAAN|nr:uncharacterized protein HKW66_Vig0089980 [Vigna angularis]
MFDTYSLNDSRKQDNAAKDLLEVGDPSNRKGASKGEGKTNGPSTGELQKPDPETKEPKGLLSSAYVERKYTATPRFSVLISNFV